MTETDTPSRDALHPRLTPNVTGHEAAVQRFIDAAQGGRLHHAWLLTGPKGVGKATLAYHMARFLLAGKGKSQQDDGPALFDEAEAPSTPSFEVDADSPTFQLIAQNAHPNLRVVTRPWDDKKGRRKAEIPVDSVRNLHPFFGMTATDGGWRIAIVDAADEMNRAASNALLKILEEPPAHTLLILIAHSPGKLLPTIRSRCLPVPLKPLPQDAVQSVLMKRMPDIGEDEARRLAILADGAPGRAMRLAHIKALDVYDDALTLYAALPDLKTTALHALAGKYATPKMDEQYHVLLDFILETPSRVVRAAKSDRPLRMINGREKEIFQHLEGRTPLDQWITVWEKMGQFVSRANALNLDRRQVIFGLAHELQGATR